MSGICAKCNNATSDDSVKSVECASVLDLSKKLTRRTNFRCEKCKGATSVNSTDSEDGFKSSILRAITDIRSDFNTTLNLKLGDFETKINESLNSKLSEIEKTIANIGGSFESSIDSLKAENELRRDECAQLRTKCNSLSQEVSTMKEQIQDMQQYMSPNENMFAVLQAIAAAINTPWRRDDVSAAHRLGFPRGRQARPPNIVVRFVSRTVRAEWPQAAKSKRNLDAVHISSAYSPSSVYINEHLTSYTKALLNQAKTMVKDRQLAFAWIKEGRVLVKNTADERARRVRSFEDLGVVDRGRRGGGDNESSHAASGK
ncbi:hypothetical protein J6590_055656 [Homalodisca vitripennis]|nr:hypothetical protein J6590_055656 [Homalodisca vitripennis]